MQPYSGIRAFRFAQWASPRLLARMYLADHILRGIVLERAIIEIGSGLGDFAAYLRARFPQCVLVLNDLSAQSAAHLAKRFDRVPNVEFHHGDVLFGPIVGRALQLIVACEVFEHLEDDLAAFRRVAEMLEPGGYFLFSAPLHMRRWQSADVFAGHHRRYEWNQLYSLSASVGLAIQRIGSYGFPSYNLLQPLRLFYYRSGNRVQTLPRGQATARSGVDRPWLTRAGRFPIMAAMTPLLLIERLFWRTRAGDGVVFLAQRV